MNTFLTEARQTLVPRGEAKHGPLPPLSHEMRNEF